MKRTILVLFVLALMVAPLHAEVLEQYENVFFWKIDGFSLGMGAIYDLDSEEVLMGAGATLLGLSVVYPNLKLGLGMKLSTDYAGTSLDYPSVMSIGVVKYPIYVYFMPFYKTMDKVVYASTGEGVLAKRKIRPFYAYFGIDLFDADGDMLEAGICWAPLSFVNLKVGYIDINNGHYYGYLPATGTYVYTFIRGIHATIEITLGAGWNAKTKAR